MPRPTRLEFEGAFHHVMNRGRNRQTIFHDRSYYEAFLKTLKDANEKFDAVIHAYCLMGNHYHLLIETPRANLSRIMQHINGLYTQRHNRLRKTDGTLFRGRYKSVLVDEDAYFLQLSRYIHRNPIEVKRSRVSRLEATPWSSYPAYINKIKAPGWLCQEKTYQMLGQKHRYKGYLNYVEKGVDEDIKRFYSKGNILSVLGSKEFKDEKQQEFKTIDLDQLRRSLQDRPSLEEMVNILCRIRKLSEADIRDRAIGQRKNKADRAFAMYACQHYGGIRHKDIADYFGLSHVGSVSHSITRIRKEIAEGGWKSEINRIEKCVYIVKCA